jgi:hypothetical protein
MFLAKFNHFTRYLLRDIQAQAARANGHRRHGIPVALSTADVEVRHLYQVSGSIWELYTG